MESPKDNRSSFDSLRSLRMTFATGKGTGFGLYPFLFILLSDTDWLYNSLVIEKRYQPRMYANISGATIDASDSMMNLGVSSPSLPHVIFSFGTAPEYDP